MGGGAHPRAIAPLLPARASLAASARSGRGTPRDDGCVVARRDPPSRPAQPPREPTWQDRLENLKEYGENDVPRKLRSPATHPAHGVQAPHRPQRRRQDLALRNESPGSRHRRTVARVHLVHRHPRVGDARASFHRAGALPARGDPNVLFLVVRNRYPAASLQIRRAPPTRLDVDKIAIAVNATQLAEAAGVEVTTLGDPSNYDTLARAAKALRDSRVRALRETVSELCEDRSERVPLLLGLSGMMQTLIPPEMMRDERHRRVRGGRVDARPDHEGDDGGPNGGDGTGPRQCRYLEATGARASASTCASSPRKTSWRPSSAFPCTWRPTSRREDVACSSGRNRCRERQGLPLPRPAPAPTRSGPRRNGRRRRQRRERTVPSGERVGRAGDAGAGVGQVWGAAGEGAAIT